MLAPRAEALPAGSYTRPVSARHVVTSKDLWCNAGVRVYREHYRDSRQMCVGEHLRRRFVTSGVRLATHTVANRPPKPVCRKAYAKVKGETEAEANQSNASADLLRVVH